MKTPGKSRAHTPRTAHQTVMDLLSRRDHSEKELKQKLAQREFSNEEIESAVETAKNHRWLGEPSEVAERFAEELHRKNKGIHFINGFLHEKGLPPVNRDENLELEKARNLITAKYAGFSSFTREEKLKVMRFLTSRGFDSSTIRKVSHDEEF